MHWPDCDHSALNKSIKVSKCLERKDIQNYMRFFSEVIAVFPRAVWKEFLFVVQAKCYRFCIGKVSR